MDPSRSVLGDRSLFSRKLLLLHREKSGGEWQRKEYTAQHTSFISKRVADQLGVKPSDLPPELQARINGFTYLFKAWGQCLLERSASQKPQKDELVDKLKAAAECFEEAWPGATRSDYRHLPETARREIEGEEGFVSILIEWLVSTANWSRGHEVVLDWFLYRIFVEEPGPLPAADSSHDEKARNIYSGEDRARRWLARQFTARIHSLLLYREWAFKDPDDPSRLKHNAAIDYCGMLDNSVCTPVLVAGDKHAAVLWLTVDLFKDHLGAFIPDLFSLGMTQIAQPLEDGSKIAGLQDDKRRELEEEQVGVLSSFDAMWRLSGLADLGYSGRWRLTNRPTISKHDASLLDFESVKLVNAGSITGRSAECATLVSLLAAGGLAYGEKPGDGETSDRVALNPFYAVTATVGPPPVLPEEAKENDQSAADIPDPRHSKLGEVYSIGKKAEAARSYAFLAGSVPLIDTVLLAGETEDIKAVMRGIHFQPCETVQDALNWMLSANEWQRALSKSKLEAWEQQWDILRDKDGYPIGLDGKSVPECSGVSTGSISHMKSFATEGSEQGLAEADANVVDSS